MAVERHCMYHCMYQQAKILYLSQTHRRLREMARASLFYIYLMRVNLTWVDGANSCSPPCNSLGLQL
jgi:hypothetical protein